MATLVGRELGRCTACLRQLFLNPENGLCINCENDSLNEKVMNLELCLAQCRKEKTHIYNKLLDELKKAAGDLA